MNPPAAPGRTRGYDFARAVAIVGMVLINFPIFLLASRAEYAGSLGGWIADLHYGRAAALFVTIAGAGIGLMARGAGHWSVRRTLILRAIFLLVVGNFLILVWRIDILHFYAFYLAIAALLFVALPRAALLPSAALVGVATIAIAALWPDLGGREYFTPLGMAENVLVTGIHPVLPWISYVLVGMWLSGIDLRDGPTRLRLIAAGALMGAGAPLLSAGVEWLVLQGYLSDALLPYLGVRHSPSPFYLMGAWGTSILAIGISQAIVMRWGEALFVRAMISAGQLAFTIYLTHALVGVVVARDFLGLGGMTLLEVIVYSFAFSAVVIVLAFLWRLRFDRGPVEWLMRSFAGNSPEKRTRPAPRTYSSPGVWVWPVVATATIAVVAFQIVGPQARLGCAEGEELGAPVRSALTLTCPREEFALSVTERSDVAIETHSGHDLYLEVYAGDELVAENDDGGEGLNARAVATLEPGVYRVVARPFDAMVGGFIVTRADSAPTVRELAAGEICTDSCRTSRDQECDDGGPDSLYAICALGTDCADCGVRSEADYQSLIGDDGMICRDSCGTANDHECDDGGPDSLYSVCAYGTDCADCGAREPRR